SGSGPAGFPRPEKAPEAARGRPVGGVNMNFGPVEASPGSEELSTVLAALLEAFEQGPAPDRMAWVNRYPEFAGELEELFASREQLEPWAAPVRSLVRVPLEATQHANDPHKPNGRDDGLLDLAFQVGPRGFGDYELLEVIAQGGMGIVYQAR